MTGAQNFGYHLHRAFAALTDVLSRELQAAGAPVSPSQFAILQAVAREPGVSQNGLARRLGRDAAALSRSLRRLEQQGLVRRAPINGCTKGVFPTPQAQKLRPALQRAAARANERALQILGAGGIEHALALLDALATALEVHPR